MSDYTDDFWDAVRGIYDQATYLGSLSSSPHDEKTAKRRALATLRKHVRTLHHMCHGGLDGFARGRMADLFGEK